MWNGSGLRVGIGQPSSPARDVHSSSIGQPNTRGLVSNAGGGGRSVIHQLLEAVRDILTSSVFSLFKCRPQCRGKVTYPQVLLLCNRR